MQFPDHFLEAAEARAAVLGLPRSVVTAAGWAACSAALAGAGRGGGRHRVAVRCRPPHRDGAGSQPVGGGHGGERGPRQRACSPRGCGRASRRSGAWSARPRRRGVDIWGSGDRPGVGLGAWVASVAACRLLRWVSGLGLDPGFDLVAAAGDSHAALGLNPSMSAIPRRTRPPAHPEPPGQVAA